MRQSKIFLLAITFAAFRTAEAQANYEIQVYPAETAEKGSTFFELHSNFTGSGSTNSCV